MRSSRYEMRVATAGEVPLALAGAFQDELDVEIIDARTGTVLSDEVRSALLVAAPLEIAPAPSITIPPPRLHPPTPPAPQPPVRSRSGSLAPAARRRPPGGVPVPVLIAAVAVVAVLGVAGGIILSMQQPPPLRQAAPDAEARPAVAAPGPAPAVRGDPVAAAPVVVAPPKPAPAAIVAPAAPPAQPLAVTSTVSASYYCGFDKLSALNDGLVPGSSHDPNTPRLTFWDRKGVTEWVQYDFAKPAQVKAVEVYWFDDGGGTLVPASWQVQWRDGAEWKAVAAPAPGRCDLDRFNRLDFAPVTTAGLRLVVTTQQSASAGMLEWRVVAAGDP